MTAQQKERILKMIEVYMDALEFDIKCGLNLHMENTECNSIDMECYDERSVAYLDWDSFDEDIKEMEEYIKEVKHGK